MLWGVKQVHRFLTDDRGLNDVPSRMKVCGKVVSCGMLFDRAWIGSVLGRSGQMTTEKCLSLLIKEEGEIWSSVSEAEPLRQLS